MPRPEDVDIELIIEDPEGARHWLLDYMDSSDIVQMSDLEVVETARSILKTIEIPNAMRKKELLDGIEIH